MSSGWLLVRPFSSSLCEISPIIPCWPHSCLPLFKLTVLSHFSVFHSHYTVDLRNTRTGLLLPPIMDCLPSSADLPLNPKNPQASVLLISSTASSLFPFVHFFPIGWLAIGEGDPAGLWLDP